MAPIYIDSNLQVVLKNPNPKMLLKCAAAEVCPQRTEDASLRNPMD